MPLKDFLDRVGKELTFAMRKGDYKGTLTIVPKTSPNPKNISPNWRISVRTTERKPPTIT